MIKFKLTILLYIIGVLTLAQEPLTYTEVVKVDSIKQDELYNRARTWFAKAYVNSKEVLQNESKESGQLVGKANFEYNQSFISGSAGTNGVINYFISIYLKDGRYKYEITQFIHKPSSNTYSDFNFGLITTDEKFNGKLGGMTTESWRNRVWNDIKKQIDENMKPLVESLKKSMVVKSEVKNTDW